MSQKEDIFAEDAAQVGGGIDVPGFDARARQVGAGEQGTAEIGFPKIGIAEVDALVFRWSEPTSTAPIFPRAVT